MYSKTRFFHFCLYCFLVVFLPLSYGKRRKSSVVICVYWIWFTLMCVTGKLAFYHWCFLYLPSLLGTQSPFKSMAFKQSYRGWAYSLSWDRRKKGGRNESPTSFFQPWKSYSQTLSRRAWHSPFFSWISLFGLIFLLQVICPVDDACTCDPKFLLRKTSRV